MPSISVVIPAYNDAPTLPRAVNSCLAQTCSDIEVIVVDDASTDSTPSVLEGLEAQDPRVRTVRHETNQQALEARRTGVLAATSPYVLLLDGDDWLDEGACEQSLALAERTGADIVQFSIVPEYGDAAPDEATVAGRAGMYAARDLEATGDDIVHATYRDDKVVWSLCGKLFSRDLLVSAFAKVPPASMFQCEDAYLYFVIACTAQHLVASSALPAYRYSMGVGDTQADNEMLSADQYESICRNHAAAERVSEFLDLTQKERGDVWDTFRPDYEALCERLLADPASRLPFDIAEDQRGLALDALLAHWPAPDAIGWVAAHHWGGDDPLRVVHALAGAKSLRASDEPGDGVVYVSYATPQDDRPDDAAVSRCTQRVHSLDSDVRAVVFPEGGMKVTEGTDGEHEPQMIGVPWCDDFQGILYVKRARALAKLLEDLHPDTVLLEPVACNMLAYDQLLVRSLGMRCFVANDVHAVFDERDRERAQAAERNVQSAHMAQLEGTLKERDGRISELVHELSCVEGSASFKVGRAITSPLRGVRDTLHAKPDDDGHKV